MTKHLYNTKDVAEARKELTKRQGNVDPITKLEIPDKQHVLDHDHSTHYVRAVLHRQTNTMLGKIENGYIRYLRWWYDGTLSDFLRGVADYLDKEHPQEYLHPSFIRELNTKFNKLNEKGKQDVLKELNLCSGKNAKERKEAFRKFVLSKKLTRVELLNILDKALTET